MIHPGVVDQVQPAPRAACAGIRGPIDQTPDPGLEQGPGAHRAGLYGDVEIRPIQAPVPDPPGSPSQGQRLGVRQGIPKGLAQVPPARQPLVSPNHHRPDRHFPQGQRPASGPKGYAHPDSIVHQVPSSVFRFGIPTCPSGDSERAPATPSALAVRPRSVRSGAPGRDRTCNLRLRRPTLYPLSYRRPFRPERHPQTDRPAQRTHPNTGALRLTRDPGPRSAQPAPHPWKAARIPPERPSGVSSQPTGTASGVSSLRRTGMHT